MKSGCRVDFFFFFFCWDEEWLLCSNIGLRPLSASILRKRWCRCPERMVVVLDNVHPEDRVVIQNVVAAIQALKAEKILLSWTVDAANGAYTINAYISDSVDCEFSRAELDTIHDVNPLRVLSASVARSSGKLRLRVRVSDRNEPLMLTETQIVSVRKRARWATG